MMLRRFIVVIGNVGDSSERREWVSAPALDREWHITITMETH